jgi:hypothetical protein
MSRRGCKKALHRSYESKKKDQEKQEQKKREQEEKKRERDRRKGEAATTEARTREVGTDKGIRYRLEYSNPHKCVSKLRSPTEATCCF